MSNSRRPVRMGLIILPMAMLIAALIPAVPARAAGPIETMSLWRLQVRVTTGDTATASTNGKPALRFNSSSTGVRTLNPRRALAFPSDSVSTFDLKLFDSPSQLTMLRIGIAGSDDWCIKKVELIFNQKVAFAQDAVAGGSACATVKAGTYLEYTSAQLRSNRSWSEYGATPALPSGIANPDLRNMVASVAGSAMVSLPGVEWNPTKPLNVIRRNSTSLGVSFGVTRFDPAGIEYPEDYDIGFDVQPYLGTDGRLHARKINQSCCHHLVTINDVVVAHLDQVLTRMTPPRPGQRLLFSIDSGANINWRYAA